MQKQEKIQQDCLWKSEQGAAHQKTRCKYRPQQENNETEKLIKLSNRYYLQKKNEHFKKKYLLRKTNRHGNTRRSLGDVNRIRKRMRFSGL